MNVHQFIWIKEEFNEQKYALISNIEFLQLEKRKKQKSITPFNHCRCFPVSVPLLFSAIAPTNLHKLEAQFHNIYIYLLLNFTAQMFKNWLLQSFVFECPRWRLFKKRVVYTKLNIYIIIIASMGGYNRMVVGYATAYAISAYHH